MSQKFIRPIQVLIASFLLADALYLTGLFFSPVRLFALVMIGRSPACPLQQAIRSEDDGRKQTEIQDRIFKASRMVEKDNSGFTLWETPQGRFWVPTGTEAYVPFYQLAEQERNIYGTGERAVRTGDVVLDCGANIGVYTKKALANGAQLVVAIEPSPKNLECLRRNLAGEVAAGRAIIVPKGVWNKPDFLVMHISPTNTAADSFVKHWGETYDVPPLPLTTIDLLVAELKLGKVDFIKLDIEGAEKEALAGARATLTKFKPRLAIATEHLIDDGEKIPAVVRSLAPGYHMQCGPCVDSGNRILPDVLYFY